MEVKRLKLASFASRGKDSFFDEVISRVDSYFEEKDLSPYANNKCG